MTCPGSIIDSQYYQLKFTVSGSGENSRKYGITACVGHFSPDRMIPSGGKAICGSTR